MNIEFKNNCFFSSQNLTYNWIHNNNFLFVFLTLTNLFNIFPPLVYMIPRMGRRKIYSISLTFIFIAGIAIYILPRIGVNE